MENPQISIYVVIDEPNVADQATGGYAMIIARKIMTEVLPYLGIYQTEEITDEVLEYLGITREDAEAGRVVETEEETDEYGNPVSTEETDAYGNTVQTEESEQGAVSNPDIPRPLQDTGQNDQTQESQGGVTNEDLGIE